MMRDLDAATHQRVFVETVANAPGADDDLASSLYATLPAALRAYDDAGPVLAELRRRGVMTAVISNIGFDIRPVLECDGLLASLNAVVLSFEVGVKKLDRRIFELTVERLGVPAPSNQAHLDHHLADPARWHRIDLVRHRHPQAPGAPTLHEPQSRGRADENANRKPPQ